MKKKSIALIIGFMSVALLGVMAMQYYFIRESYRLKVQLFDQSVNEALNAVVYKVDKRAADNFLKHQAPDKLKNENDDPENIQNRIDYYANLLKEKQLNAERDFKIQDSLFRTHYPQRLIPVEDDFYETYTKNPEQLSKLRLEKKVDTYRDPFGRIFYDESYMLFADDPDKKKLRKTSADTARYMDIDNIIFISLPRFDPKVKASIMQDALHLKKEKKALDSVKNVKQKTSVFEDLAKDYEQANIPLLERVDPGFIDTLLKQELSNRDIRLYYDYEMSLPDSPSALFTSTGNKKPEFRNENTSYRISLFPKEIGRQSGILTLIFPDKGTLILQNMNIILFSSASLLLVLVGCFAYTIFIILRQKKISEMKTDFINNMTHEFKTPVATIMIASEALKDPEVTEDESRIRRLAGIIYDENVRLGNHIERVLNIAKIDRDDLKLEHKDIDMNELIGAVVDSMELQLQKKQIKVTMDLKAEHPVVKGDELHLSNVIFNLMDNAIKYSKDEPEISISTHNSGKNLVIHVRDNGIGMNRDQLSKIFDQFYRIPTGNLHDVKGFGLGLSYVSNIIKLLQGSIHVKSEKNKGSEFEIILRVA